MAVVAVVLTVAGCSSPTPGAAGDAAEPSSSVSVAASSPPASPTPMAAPPGAANFHDGGPVAPIGPEPVWDEASRAAAVGVATAAMTAFARPEASFEDWWAQLSPALSAQAQIDYQYVDPANVPARAVTGPAVLADVTSPSVVGVQVSTDVGDYLLVLSRAQAGAPWLVERITPPETVG